MTPLAEDPSILQTLSAWWSRLRLTQNNVPEHRIPQDRLQHSRDAYQEVASKRSQYSALHWQEMADGYRNKMRSGHISDQLREYYANEARLCDAEAKKVSAGRVADE
jgi:hypothetical protein